MDNPQPSAQLLENTNHKEINPDEIVHFINAIYLITCLTTRKQYVGQTTVGAEKRWEEHKTNANNIIRARNGEYPDTTTKYFKGIRSSKLYKAMADEGIHNFTFKVLESFPTYEGILNSEEVFYIQWFGTYFPGGYNMTRGGDSKYKHHPESIELMKKVKRENLDNNRHEYLKGLPECVTFDKERNVIIIKGHPLCKHKTFPITDADNIENCRNAVIDFIGKLKKSGKPYEKEKVDNLIDYPGLKSTPKGYKIERQYKGNKFHAGFESQKFTRDENKASAIIEWQEVDKKIQDLIAIDKANKKKVIKVINK